MLRCASGSCKDAAGGATGELVGDRSEYARFVFDELEEMWKQSQIIRVRRRKTKAGCRCCAQSKGRASRKLPEAATLVLAGSRNNVEPSCLGTLIPC